MACNTRTWVILPYSLYLLKCYKKELKEGCHRVRCSFGNTAMAAKHLVADDSGDRHAVEHVVHKLVKQPTVNGAKCQCALVMEAAGAVLIEPPAGA